MNLCKIDGCGKPVRGHGLCNAHHIRLRRYGDPLGQGGKTLEERFWPKVDASGGPSQCWHWTAAFDKDDGYGRFTIAGRSHLAHRVSFSLAFGPVGSDVEIDHTCFTRLCVNPKHLRPVTHKQNNENRRSANRNSKTGVRGVFPCRGGYRAEVRHHRTTIHVGIFPTLDEAAEAVRLRRIELFTHNDVDRANEIDAMGTASAVRRS
ncbi:HNH endonuclease [Mycolicibacterium fortuitum]|uniref:HNH endonuclease n=1 Tax=Mycolicibacterium fortuitum TaxID=1766 RepID=UPI00097B6D3F|nr:hypothetical protein A5734_03770 [Mycolicibacterium fortuitum]